MKINCANYLMPVKRNSVQSFGANLPFLTEDSPNYPQIVADESSGSGLASLPTDKVASHRGGFVWDLALKEPVTMPGEVAAQLLRMSVSDLKAFDNDSRVFVQSMQILPETKIVSWGVYSLDTLSLVVGVFKDLIKGATKDEILKKLKYVN